MNAWSAWRRERWALVDEIAAMRSLTSVTKRLGHLDNVERFKARRAELEAKLNEARLADLTGPPPAGLTREQFAGLAAKETLTELRRAGRRCPRATLVELMEHHRRLCEIAEGRA